MVRLHPVRRSYALIRSWVSDKCCWKGWYINLEQPWRRTTVGFDTRDDVLDVTVADDLSDCRLKDEDELQHAVRVGLFSEAEAESIRLVAEIAIGDVKQRWWPFDESTWSAIRPIEDLPLPVLPEGWDCP